MSTYLKLIEPHTTKSFPIFLSPGNGQTNHLQQCLFLQSFIMSKLLRKAQEVRVKLQETAVNPNEVITASKRMKIDVQNFAQNVLDNVIIRQINEGSVADLHIIITPHENSFYRNSKITFGYHTTEKYPYEAPEVKCLNKILHPNIDKSGNVCLNLLREGWKPNYELYMVVIGLLHLLENLKAADLEKPLDAEAAALMNKGAEEFSQAVQQTIRGNAFMGRQFDNVYFVPVPKKK